MEFLVPIFISVWGIICFYLVVGLCYDLNKNFCSCCNKTIKVKNIYLINKDYQDYQDKICPICLEEFTKEKPPSIINFCENNNHPFHDDCITKHFKNNNLNCPVCRKTLITEV